MINRLGARTENIRQAPEADRVAAARQAWKGSKSDRQVLSAVLRSMAHGRECCMYCSDGQGTSVDHYCPMAIDPLRTWEWENHILACVVCNSHNKRALFPLDVDGTPLFLDPTKDDPFVHLVLTPSTGRYVGRTARGGFTADALLNGDLLQRGRKAAWGDALDHLRSFAEAARLGNHSDCIDRQYRLTQRPNLDAFYYVLRYAADPNGSRLLPADVVQIVSEYEDVFWSWLGMSPPHDRS